MSWRHQVSFPADHFNVNNTNNNPKRFILLSIINYYSGKQIRHSKNQSNFDFMTKSSSAKMYIKQAVCYSKTNWWKVDNWKPVLAGKTTEAKEKPGFFVLIERPWTNFHAVKAIIKRTTSCLNLTIKARKTAKWATSCALRVNSEQAMARKTIEKWLKWC